jgi:hypothetical protein
VSLSAWGHRCGVTCGVTTWGHVVSCVGWGRPVNGSWNGWPLFPSPKWQKKKRKIPESNFVHKFFVIQNQWVSELQFMHLTAKSISHWCINCLLIIDHLSVIYWWFVINLLIHNKITSMKLKEWEKIFANSHNFRILISTTCQMH